MAGKFTVDSGPKRTYSKPKWTEGLVLTPEEEAEALRINNEMLEAQVKAAEREAEERKIQAAADKKYYADLARQQRWDYWMGVLSGLAWFFGWAAFWVGVVLVFIGMCCVADYAWSSKQCQVYTEISNSKTAYSYFTGCMVEIHPGKWVTLDSASTRSNEVTLRGDK